MKNKLSVRGALALALLAGSAMITTTATAAEAPAKPAQIRVQTGEGLTVLAARINQFTRMTTKSAGMVGILIRAQTADAYRVEVFRLLASGDPHTMSPKNFTLADSFQLASNSSASRPLSGGLNIEVNIPTNAAADLDIGEDDTAGCCVYCDNGVEICGTKVRSSCGNCG